MTIPFRSASLPVFPAGHAAVRSEQPCPADQYGRRAACGSRLTAATVARMVRQPKCNQARSQQWCDRPADDAGGAAVTHQPAERCTGDCHDATRAGAGAHHRGSNASAQRPDHRRSATGHRIDESRLRQCLDRGNHPTQSTGNGRTTVMIQQHPIICCSCYIVNTVSYVTIMDHSSGINYD